MRCRLITISFWIETSDSVLWSSVRREWQTNLLRVCFFPGSTLADTVDLPSMCQPPGGCVFAESRLIATPGSPLLNQYVVMHEGKTHKYNRGAKLPVSCFDGFIVPSAFVKNTLLTSWVGRGLGW